MPVTSPSKVVTLACLRNRWRTGAAIADADSPAVATWYSSGWNRWWLVLSTSVIVHRRMLERAGRFEAAEAAADDDDHGV